MVNGDARVEKRASLNVRTLSTEYNAVYLKVKASELRWGIRISTGKEPFTELEYNLSHCAFRCSSPRIKIRNISRLMPERVINAVLPNLHLSRCEIHWR